MLLEQVMSGCACQEIARQGGEETGGARWNYNRLHSRYEARVVIW